MFKAVTQVTQVVVALLLALFASLALAAVEVNKASATELTQISGIGSATAEKIVTERAKSDFKDWDDFIARVSGVGPAKAASFSQSGLTVHGKPLPASASSTAAPAASPQTKASIKTAPASAPSK